LRPRAASCPSGHLRPLAATRVAASGRFFEFQIPRVLWPQCKYWSNCSCDSLCNDTLYAVAKCRKNHKNLLKHAEVCWSYIFMFSCFHVFTEPEALQCQVETPLFVAFNGDHFALLLGNARRPRQWMQSMACIDTQWYTCQICCACPIFPTRADIVKSGKGMNTFWSSLHWSTCHIDTNNMWHHVTHHDISCGKSESNKPAVCDSLLHLILKLVRVIVHRVAQVEVMMFL
jgi:hypothetical protein